MSAPSFTLMVRIFLVLQVSYTLAQDCLEHGFTYKGKKDKQLSKLTAEDQGACELRCGLTPTCMAFTYWSTEAKDKLKNRCYIFIKIWGQKAGVGAYSCSRSEPITPAPVLNYWTGQPGIAWTEDEMLAVKAKIVQVFLSSGKVYKEYMKLHPEVLKPDTSEDNPNAAKMLRLGFHDCLKTEDGGGGCDGCLNPTGMGVSPFDKYDLNNGGKAPEVKFTDNNGLGMTVNVLEEIYTNTDFPSGTPSLELSLAASGKTRADLWAFATLMATEWGIDRNNHACIGEVSLGDKASCGHIQAGTPHCLLNTTALPTFHTGRVDCEPNNTMDKPWKTSAHEIHPSSHGNGVQTADFFKEHFGLTGRQGAALLIGAHSFGKFNVNNGLFKYSWTRAQGNYLNNQLFRHLAMKPQYKGDCAKGQDPWTLTGDYLGQPAETRWLVRGNKFTASGGPFQWGHWYLRCPSTNDCARMTADEAVSSRNSSTPYPGDPAMKSTEVNGPTNRAEPNTPEGCCDDLEAGMRCRPECQRYIVNDETALSVDVGYMLTFDVSESTGLPTGCKAFDEARGWSDDTTSKGYAGPIDCPLQEYAPEGEPLHAVVEEFAEDQDAWLRDFLPSLELMLANGAVGLVEAPGSWWGAHCGKQGKTLICSPQ